MVCGNASITITDVARKKEETKRESQKQVADSQNTMCLELPIGRKDRHLIKTLESF